LPPTPSQASATRIRLPQCPSLMHASVNVLNPITISHASPDGMEMV
jgi:hypothetical protein